MYDVALLDLDGVVYIGPHAVPGVAAALTQARHTGMRLAFVTNNAARTPVAVAAHLNELGVQAQPEEVVTSAQAAARYLAEHLPGGAEVLVLGTTGLYEALRKSGLQPVAADDGDVAAVVQGYSPEMSWQMLAEGAVAINRGVPWVATNVDPTVPSPRGPLPGNGALVAALRLATGATPVVTGKPDPTMHRESLLRSGATSPIVVGDRLDTDIEGAIAAGCPSLLVFSGVTSPRELLAARPDQRPDYVSATLAGLLDDHRAPQLLEQGASCGRWLATVRDTTVHLEIDAAGTEVDAAADDDPLNAVRAACAAWWAARDASGSTADDAAMPSVEAGEGGAAGVLREVGLTRG